MATGICCPFRAELGPHGTPTHFTWRGERYTVLQVLAQWHLCDRWWVSPVAVALGDEARGHSDHHYFRLLVPKQQVFEVYHEPVANAWVLDVVQD